MAVWRGCRKKVAVTLAGTAAGDVSSDNRSWVNLLDPMFRSAIETLKEPQLSEKRFDRFTRDAAATKLSHPKLLGLDALRLDSTEITREGRTLGLIALPSIVRSPVAELYPRQTSSLLRPRDISFILESLGGRAPGSRSPGLALDAALSGSS
jgi:hypothetical protein